MLNRLSFGIVYIFFSSIVVSDVEFNKGTLPMKKDKHDIQNDLLALALIFIIFCISISYFMTHIEHIKYENKLKNELLQAKELTVYYYNRSDTMENNVVSLNEHITYLEGIISQKDALDAETAKLKRIVLELRLDTQKKRKK